MREAGSMSRDPREQAAVLGRRGDDQHRLQEDDDDDPVAEGLVVAACVRHQRRESRNRDRHHGRCGTLGDDSDDRSGQRRDRDRLAQRTTPGSARRVAAATVTRGVAFDATVGAAVALGPFDHLADQGEHLVDVEGRRR